MTNSSEILPAPTLLDVDEPAAYRIANAQGSSPFFIICDHASARVPRQLASLGVSAEDLQRHIAWDIGASGVAVKLADTLDAFAILQNYSRLVIDCNRPLGSAGSIVALSERTRIPGNENLSAAQVQLREQQIFIPYHARIRCELDARLAQHRTTILISMHSFTPVFLDNRRAMHVGVLYHRDSRFAHPLLELLRQEPAVIVGDNEPYRVTDTTDYAIPEYGERGGLLHAELEIRQDLIGSDRDQATWAARLARILSSLAESFA